MHGTNPIRSPETGDGSVLQLQSMFRTLQGEGPYAGWPAVFIRLGGCNLACDFCDTEFESYEATPLEQVVQHTQELAGATHKLVVITGGEPLRQPIGPLCAALIEQGFKVQLETNGTLWRELPQAVEWICSPKNAGKGYFPLRPDVMERVSALKFIVSATHPGYAEAPDVGQPKDMPIYVQPMDEQDAAKNAANLQHAVALAMENGYRLCVQLHKLAGIE